MGDWLQAQVGPLRLPLLASSTIPFNGIFTVIMVLAFAVALMVTVILAYIITRFRGRPGDALPVQQHGSRRLEIIWTVLPTLVLVGLFTYMVGDMRRGPTPGAGVPVGQDPDIIVVGHQWWWEIRYPKHGDVLNANEVHLPVGGRVLVQLTSADVQHDFWVPPLGQKMDLYPGKTNYLWLEAPAAGEYRGACAEFCGAQHAWMRIVVFVQPREEYDAWIGAQRASAETPADDQAAQGQRLFGQYACGNCHRIAGTAADGRAAPALTNFSARRTIAAGVLPQTPDNLARYLRNPQEVKPGSYMPNFRLSEPEVQALVAYLESLR